MHVLCEDGMVHEGPVMTWRGTMFLKCVGRDHTQPYVVYADMPLLAYNALPTWSEGLLEEVQ
jgi:hypothetical protein